MKKLIYTSVLVTLFIYSKYTLANCVKNPNFSGANKILPSGTYNVQFDEPNNTTIATISTSTLVSKQTPLSDAPSGMYCQGQLISQYLSNWGGTLSDSTIGTNIPGIRLRVNISGSYVPHSSARTTTAYEIVPTVKWVVDIIKSGDIPQGGYLDGLAIAEYYQYNHVNGSRFHISRLSLPTNGIKINVSNCTIKNTAFSVNLGDWYDNQFSAVGNTSTEVDIPITLNCSAKANIKATVIATSGTINAKQGQLALSGGVDKATGVAIQIVDTEKNPIPLNDRLTIKDNVAAGDYIFGWKARYIKTADKITPGPANGTATINIRYE